MMGKQGAAADVIHTLALSVGLTILWFLWSGYFVPLLLGLGAASVVVVLWLAHRMDVVDHESHPVSMATKGLLYFPWLLWEICKSNWDVAKAVLRGRAALAPRVLTITASQVSDVGRVIHANSITLTPGTITLSVEENIFEVHALTPGAAAGLLTGDMDRRVRTLEGRVKPGTEGEG
jgi:multicomponent Na+:H+ antiporter subunit E